MLHQVTRKRICSHETNIEQIWGEEVEAAFMEALQIYPPMGNRRFKYYPVSSLDIQGSENPPTKSFGRCQLIQLYIHQKTGKMRTRKQISSHLQKFKKSSGSDSSASELNHHMLLSSTTPGASAVSNLPFDSAKNFKSTPSNLDNSVAAGLSSSNLETANLFFISSASENLRKQHGFYRTILLEPRLVHTTDMSLPFDNNSNPYHSDQNRSEDQHASNLHSRDFGVSINNTFDFSPSASAHSMTQRRLASSIPVLQSQLHLSPSAFHSRNPSSSASQSSNEPMLPRASPDSNRALAISYALPLTPVDQLLHPPLQPPEIHRLDRKNEHPRADEYSQSWLWPSVDSSLYAFQSPLHPFLSGVSATSTPALDRLPASADTQHISTCSTQVHTPIALHQMPLRIPRRLSYSHPHTLISSPPTFNSISSTPDGHFTRSGNSDPFISENLASPLDIKCFSSDTDAQLSGTFSSMGSPLSVETP